MVKFNHSIKGCIMKSKSVLLLDKEKELLSLLNQAEPPDDIDEQFKALFKEPLFENAYKFLEKNTSISMHDARVLNLSQKKDFNKYKTSFTLDFMSFYKSEKEQGYIRNSKVNFISTQPLRELNKKTIVCFIADEDNNEISFLYIDNHKGKIVSTKYENFEFKKGVEFIST